MPANLPVIGRTGGFSRSSGFTLLSSLWAISADRERRALRAAPARRRFKSPGIRTVIAASFGMYSE